MSTRRRQRARQLLALVGLVATMLLAPRRASACSCDFNVNRFYAEGGAIPVDGGGLLWLTSFEHPREQLAVWRLTASGPEPVEFELQPIAVGGLQLIVPAGGLVEGQRLRFEARAIRDYRDPIAVEVEVGAAIDPDIGPWTLEAEPARWRRVEVEAPVSCDEWIVASTVDLHLEIPKELAEFRGTLLYTTYVDGERWLPAPSMCSSTEIGRNWTGATGSDRVYAGCVDHPTTVQATTWARPRLGLDPGRHSARVVIELPVQGLEFQSNTVEFELECDGVGQFDPPKIRGQGCGLTEPSRGSPGVVLMLALGCGLRSRRARGARVTS